MSGERRTRAATWDRIELRLALRFQVIRRKVATSSGVRRTANTARRHTPRPIASPSATRVARDPRAACRRALAGDDRGVRPHPHAAPQRDGQTAPRVVSSSFWMNGAGLPLLHRSSRAITLVAVSRLHSRLRCSPSINHQRPPEIIDLFELPLCVPLRKHLVHAGVD